MRLSEADLSIAPGSRAAGFLTFDSAPGIAARIPAMVVRGRRPGPTLWIQAGLHGDEVDGVVALLRWLEARTTADLAGTVIAIPALNTPAFLAGTAAHPADGMNLNRAFGSAGATWTERFAAWLLPIIVRRADAFVDLHGGGRYLDVEHFAFCDVGHDRSRLLAAASGVRYVCSASAAHGGALYRVLAAQGIPAVLIEAGSGTTWREDAVAAHLRAIENVVAALGMVDCGAPPASRVASPVIERIVELRAGEEAVVVKRAAAGGVVRWGDTVVDLRTLTGEVRPGISSPLPSAVVLSVVASAMLRIGDYACLLGELAS